MSILAAAAAVADTSPNPNSVQPGLLGLGCFVALAVATYFLWRSMNKQLKRVDDHFGVTPAAGPSATAPTAPTTSEPAAPEVPAPKPEIDDSSA